MSFHSYITRAQKLGWQVMAATEVRGDGVQAPGSVVLSYTGNAPQPYVAHFFNSQDGGFHAGNYCTDSHAAYRAYHAKVARYTRHH
jgi:hypothetical protein